MKRYIKILTLFFTLSFLWGCLEDPEVYKVTVKTDSIVEFVQGGVSVSGGIYTENEGYQPTIESSGFCYGVAEGPTLSNFVVKVKKSGIGDFNATLKSLDEGTKYYVRAFAQNKYGVVYGEEVSFVSLTKPEVKTLSLLEENENSQLIVNCELESLGSGDITELGVCYSTENKLPNKNNDVYKLVSNIQKGKYTVSILVEPNVKYYIRAFASNLAGVAYGEVKEILTTEAIYTIKFDSNGGIGSMSPKTVSVGSSIYLSINTFTRSGYDFVDWNTNADGSGVSYTNGQNITPSGNITLYAQWKKKEYTIIFDSNGGSGSMSSKTVSSGYSVSLPANTFTRSGYEFVGWNTNADGSGVPYTNGQRITPSRNMTLYAQWKKKEVYYTITFNANGGSGNMASKTVSTGSSVTLPNNTFTRSGYEFVGWNTNSYGTGTSYIEGQTITPSRDINLYAQWKKNEVYYTITFNANGGSGSMSSMTVNATSSITLPSNKFTQSGYSFIGWNTEADGSGVSYTNAQSLTLSGDLTLYAQWRIYVSTITLNANDGSGESSSIDVSRSEKVILLNKFVRDGYVFLNWNTEADGSGLSYENAEEIMVAGDLTLYAQWRKIEYTITFNANGGRGNMASKTVSTGASVTLPNNTFTRSGYEFVAWNTSLDGNGTSYTEGQTITPLGNITLYAQWNKKICPQRYPFLDIENEDKMIYNFPATISFKISGFEDDSNIGAVYYISYGEGNDENHITLDNGDVFYYSKSYTNEELKELNGLVSFVYNLEPIYTNKLVVQIIVVGCDPAFVQNASTAYYKCKMISFNANGGSGSMTSKSVVVGSSISLPLNTFTRPGYKFTGWNTNSSGTGTSYSNGQTITPSGNITLYAQWSAYALPNVVTSTVSNITNNSAYCSGSVTSQDYTITERGICYATYSTPTISDKVVKSTTSGAGSFGCTLSSLSSGTTYYYRAYAKYNDGEVVYGSSKQFTTYVSPTVTTSSITDITYTSAYCGGNVSSSYYPITERGICYGTYSNPTISSLKVISGSGTGSYSCYLSGLSQGVTYYARAYAKYSGGVVYGDVKTFRTKTVPQVSDVYIVNKTETSLTCQVEFNSPNFFIYDKGLCYSFSPSPTIYDNTVSGGSGTSLFKCDLKNLTEGVKYYIRGYAEYNGGFVYGKEIVITPSKSNKLYFIDKGNWDSSGTIYAYMWNSVNDVPGVNDSGIYKWPGVKATLELNTYKGYTIYSFDVAGYVVDYIIFNTYNGNYAEFQTYDLKIDLSKPYYYNGLWYESLSEIP